MTATVKVSSLERLNLGSGPAASIEAKSGSELPQPPAGAASNVLPENPCHGDAEQAHKVALTKAAGLVTRALLAEVSDPPEPGAAERTAPTGEESAKRILECCEQQQLAGDCNDPTNATFCLKKLSIWVHEWGARGEDMPTFVPKLKKFFVAHLPQCKIYDAKSI